jgi:hypothetical protein
MLQSSPLIIEAFMHSSKLIKLHKAKVILRLRSYCTVRRRQQQSQREFRHQDEVVTRRCSASSMESREEGRPMTGCGC